MKRIIKRSLQVLTILLLMYAMYVIGYNVGHAKPSIAATKNQPSLLTQINDIRKEKSLSQLIEDPTLDNTALIKANDMAEKNYFEHDAPDGTRWSDFIQKNRPGSERIGENLAECYIDNNSTIAGWIASPKHYENMIAPDWTKFGTATVWDADKGCYLTVNHFSR